MRILCFFVFTLLPQLVFAQSSIDNPPTVLTSNQSGPTFIGGWHCNAENADIRVRFTTLEGTIEVATAAGTSRADTIGICGDANNGFGLGWNWNIFPVGIVNLEFVADGTVFATAQVNVTSLGAEFVSAAAVCTLTDFPEVGDSAAFRWSNSTQQLQLDSVNASPDLQALLGDWAITVYIEGIKTDRIFSLMEVLETQGLENVIGTGESNDDPLVIFRQAEREEFNFPYDFAGLDVIGNSCLFFAFQQTNSNRLDGLMGKADSACIPVAGTNLWPMFGTRLTQAPENVK